MNMLNTAPNHPDLQQALANHNARVAEQREQRRSDLGYIAGIIAIDACVEFRGEQPDEAIHLPAGASRGDVPLLKAERSEA